MPKGYYYKKSLWPKKFALGQAFKLFAPFIVYAKAIRANGFGLLSFTNYESRYRYGCFLIGLNRQEEGKKILVEMLQETSHLNGAEKRANNIGFSYTKDELKKSE